MSKIRLGALGCSVIFRSHFNGICANSDKVELVALCDINPTKLEQASKAYHVDKTYVNYLNMIADPSIDAIVNTTPTVTHAETTIACLKAGKHVLCEKPIAMTLQEADAMIKAEQETGLVLQLALQSRHSQAWRKIKELLEAGEIGTPHTITITQYWNDPWVYNNWRTVKSISGGGIIADSSVHWIDMMRYLMGEVDSVSATATASPDAPDKTIDDSSLTLFNFKSGAIGCLRNGWRNHRQPGSNENVEINGTQGTIRADLRNPWTMSGIPIVSLIKCDGPTETNFHFPLPNSRFASQIESFVKSIKAGKTLECTAQDGRRAQEIQETIYTAIKSRKWEKIS